MNKYQKGFTPIIIALIVLILAGIGGVSYYLMTKESQEQIFCTMDAKICPDGSAVGRTGPNCEFAACPEVKMDETADWKTYTNEEFGYTIKYPNDWTYREYPATQTGAGFRPINQPDEVQYEFINIDARRGAEMDDNMLFSDYVKEAAIKEIQNFEKLNSIEEIITDTGIKGYTTTWIYYSMRDNKKDISLPITYFDYRKTIESVKYMTIQSSLENKDYQKIYEQMLSTFNFISTSSN